MMLPACTGSGAPTMPSCRAGIRSITVLTVAVELLLRASLMIPVSVAIEPFGATASATIAIVAEAPGASVPIVNTLFVPRSGAGTAEENAISGG